MLKLGRYWKLLAVATSCAALGAGASVIANAGAANNAAASGATAAKHRRAWNARGLVARAVHGDLVVATKNGFATVTLDRGIVQSLSGQQLTIKEGTKRATYKTVTLTIPTSARVRDNRHKATLADLKAGQRVLVVQAPRRTLVIAHNVRGS
jgi:hypothetical protein